MKKILLSIVTIGVLAACGGGGGGSSPSLPPTPTPIPVANTSLSYYLPLATGNNWNFATGGKMQDMGSGTLQCSCVGNGDLMERVAIYPPNSSTISGSFFFTKTPAASPFGPLTNLIGVENDAYNNNITLASDATYPNGIPIIDDLPSVNEFWNDVGGSSTITAVGGTMMLPNGEEVISTATDQITGNFSPITWSFAKGIGITQIGVGPQSTTLTSFYVNTTTSKSAGRKPDVMHVFYGHRGVVELNRVLAAIVGGSE